MSDLASDLSTGPPAGPAADPPPGITRRPGETAFTGLLIAASGFLLWQAYTISGFESITSAGMFPMLAALAMLLTAGTALAKGRHVPLAGGLPGESLAQQFWRQLTPPVLVTFVLAILAYMLLLEPLGFSLASFLFLVLSMRLLGSQRWGLNLLVSALSLGAILLVFQTAFSVVLPQGVWLQGWLK